MHCDFCGSFMFFLGRLGCMDWYRCEGCGLERHQYNSMTFDTPGYDAIEDWDTSEGGEPLYV